MARVPAMPSYGVRWDRVFSFPLGVARDLDAAKRLESAKALTMSGEVLKRYLRQGVPEERNHGKLFQTGPNQEGAKQFALTQRVVIVMIGSREEPLR